MSRQTTSSSTSTSSVPKEIEVLIDKIIQTEDSDVLNPQFSHLVKQLLDNELKYNMFAKMYPDHACYDMFIRLENIGTYSSYQLHPSKYSGSWCGTDNAGAEVIVYSGPHNLWMCISESSCKRRQPGDELLAETRLRDILNPKRKTCGNLAIYLSYKNHAGMIWIDKQGKVINRFDPYFTSRDSDQRAIDEALAHFFEEFLPNFEYLGNTLSESETVQRIRSNSRKHSDNFCQDYGILYAIRRVCGMSHLEAARHMVDAKSYILEDVKQLMRQMWKLLNTEDE